jgi:mRNA interferase RelE/StbE
MMASYEIQFTVEATRDLRRLSPEVADRIMRKVARMAGGLAGDVKRLTDYSPEYRLRVGDWRVLFDVEDRTILVQQVRHRSRAYGE